MPREARGKKVVSKPAYAGKNDFFDRLRAVPIKGSPVFFVIMAQAYLYEPVPMLCFALNFRRRWSAISAMNSELVGLPREVCTV